MFLTRLFLISRLCALKGFFEAVFMVKNQTESNLQGGDCEESDSVLRG